MHQEVRPRALALVACLAVLSRAGVVDIDMPEDLEARAEYAAVCDAGSTGTRLYVFRLDFDAAKASSIFVKKTKPGLSSYVDRPSATVPPLLTLFAEGAQKVPEKQRNKTSLTIFGTAGMRLLSPTQQMMIWETVKSGLLGDTTFPFSSELFEARTVSGTEEGLWAVLTGNFLAGRMSHELLSHGKHLPLGLMDLGGSSTQIAIPAADAAKKGNRVDEGVIVHSYLGFGMTVIREEVRRSKTGGEDVACYMKGTSVERDLVGTGRASDCRALIRDMLEQKSHTCRASADDGLCLGDLAQIPKALDSIKNGSMDFYAVAGMTYVVDFVRWWLKTSPHVKERNPDGVAAADPFLEAYPRPSLTELQVAVDAMCAGDYAFVDKSLTDEAFQHPYTGPDNAPYRCFEANYILVLLENIYGFATDHRRIIFALEVAGEDLEWPLGALLHQRSQLLRGSEL